MHKQLVAVAVIVALCTVRDSVYKRFRPKYPYTRRRRRDMPEKVFCYCSQHIYSQSYLTFRNIPNLCRSFCCKTCACNTHSVSIFRPVCVCEHGVYLLCFDVVVVVSLPFCRITKVNKRGHLSFLTWSKTISGETIHHADRERIWRKRARHIEGKQNFHAEHRICTNGETMLYLSWYSLLHMGNLPDFRSSFPHRFAPSSARCSHHLFGIIFWKWFVRLVCNCETRQFIIKYALAHIHSHMYIYAYACHAPDYSNTQGAWYGMPSTKEALNTADAASDDTCAAATGTSRKKTNPNNKSVQKKYKGSRKRK